MRIVILGASGFVGATVWESLSRDPGLSVVLVAHGTGNVGRLARYGTTVEIADVLDAPSLARVLDGADGVVNCTMGPNSTLVRGITNVVSAVRNARVSRYVHLSSIRVYGQEPDQRSATEVMEPKCPRDDYGVAKWRQERAVKAGLEGRVPFVILRPSNIDGPFSSFSSMVAAQVLTGRIPVIEKGANPCNVVHVYTFAEAIHRLLHCELDDRCYHVNEPGALSWHDYFGLYRQELNPEAKFVDASAERAQRALGATERGMWRASLAAMNDTNFRNALFGVPVLGALRDRLKTRIKSLPPRFSEPVLARVQIPDPVAPEAVDVEEVGKFETMQLRPVYHDDSALRAKVGPLDRFTFRESVSLTCRWIEHVEARQGNDSQRQER
jgi:nucleoside-diphosphate-sugar epimerase